MALFPTVEMTLLLSNTVWEFFSNNICNSIYLRSVVDWVYPAQLEAGLEAIRATIGPEEQSGFTDSYIRESLWDCNFDLEETMDVLAGMSHTPLPSTCPDPPRRDPREEERCAREKR